MTIFNPDQNPVNADYTSDSKGTAAKRSYGDLFGNASDIGIGAVKVADQNNLTNIQGEVNKEIDQVNDEWGTKVSAYETNVLNSQNTQPTPADLQRYAKNLGDTRKAYLNGNLKDSNYAARIDSMSRQIRARYPGYRDQIDGIISKTLGQSTANDLRRSLMSEWNTEMSNLTEEEKAFHSEVVAGSKAGVLPPQYYEREAAGNPYSKEETRAFMAARYQQDADIDRTKKAYELNKASDDAAHTGLTKVAQKDIALTSQRIVEGAFSVDGQTFAQVQQKVTQGFTKPWSPEETAQITASFAQMQSSVKTQLWSKMNDPYYSDLSPKEKEDLVNQGMAQLDVIKDQITNQQFGLLNFSKQMNDTAIQDDLRNWTQSEPVARTIQMLSKFADGNTILNDMLLNNKDMSTKLNTALNSLMTAEIMNPQKGSMKAVLDEAKNKQGGVLAPEVIKQSVANAAKGLLTKDISLEAAQQFAKILFSEENQAMLGDFTQKSQTQLFDTLISPRMTERIAELAKSDPNIQSNYRNWVLNSFSSLFNQDVDNIKDLNKYGDWLQIKWNAEKGQFEENTPDYAGSRRPNTLANPVGVLALEYQSWQSSVARKSMNDLNKYIRQLKPIVENEGGKVEEAMTALFEKSGINAIKNEGSLYYRLNKALMGSEMMGKAPDSSERAGRYNKAINPPNPELQGFDLDKTGSGKLSSGSLLKDTIAKAEGGKSYNTRYGGADNIELSHFNVSQVMDYQDIWKKQTGSSAAGKYQVNQETLKELIGKGIIKPDEQFTPALQEKIADYLIAEARSGSKDKAGFAKRLAGRWAGLPKGPSGQSAYEGDAAGNSATISWEDFNGAL